MTEPVGEERATALGAPHDVHGEGAPGAVTEFEEGG